MNEFDQQFVIESPTGAKLNTYYKAPMGRRNRGIIHINHGLAEHAARYAKFASVLCESGFHIYAHDHRGHGYTKAPDAPQGVFSLEGNGVDKVMQDCAAVQNFAKAQHADLSLIMFGHSMGGLITMNYALHHADQLVGAAVWNSNLDGGNLGRLAQLILKFERFRLGSDVPSRMLPKLTFQTWAKQIKDRRTDFDWLSHIEAEVDAYIADQLCGWDASVGMWLDIFEMVFSGGDVSEASSSVKNLPFCLVGGGKDPATNNGKAVLSQSERMKRAGFQNTMIHLFETARHETLNDENWEKAAKLFDIFARECTNR